MWAPSSSVTRPPLGNTSAQPHWLRAPVTRVPVAVLRASPRLAADECNIASAQFDEVPRGLESAFLVVAAKRVTREVLYKWTPDHESCVRVGERRQFLPVFPVVAIAEQYEAVCTMTRLVVDVPVVAELL